MAKKNIAVEVANALDASYNKKDLDIGWKRAAVAFIKKNELLCKEEGVPAKYIDLAYQKTMNKGLLVGLISHLFISKKLFDAFRMSLHKNVRFVLDELIWTHQLTREELEEKHGIIIYDKRSSLYGGYSRHSYDLEPEYTLFRNAARGYYSSSNGNMTLFLPLDLRRALMEYYGKPRDADLNPVAKINETDYVYTSENNILLELSRIKAYASQKQIKATAKGKAQASTLGKMQRKLNLQEFYPDASEKMLKTLRTSLLAGFMVTVPRPKSEGNVHLELKQLFYKYYQENFSSTQGILTYLKGAGHFDKYYTHNVEPTMYELIKSLPKNEWISFENLDKYIEYNFIDVKPLSKYNASIKLYYLVETGDERFSYKEKRFIDNSRYHTALIRPFIKGTCFLFAAYGLLDVAYNTPDTSEMGVTANSHYDGLAYIRLNALGAYVLSKVNHYEAPADISKSSISLSESSLTITIDESDTTAPILLEPYTQRASPNRFKTDFAFFLKDVKTKKELENKIVLFKDAIQTDFPANWLQFFEELRSKIDPLKTLKSVKVFQIPSDNTELLRLIAKDATLQKLCMKAEGFHIIVTSTNLSKFKKRLQEFGYLLP